MCTSVEENSSFFSQIFPVITFVVGLFATPIFQRFNENKRLKRVENHFVQLLESLNLQIASQNREIVSCIRRIDDTNNFDLVLNKVSGRELNLIDRIDSKDIFKIIIERKKGTIKARTRILNEINSVIAFLNESILHSFNSNMKAIEQIDKCRNDWNESQKSILKLKNQFVINRNLINPNVPDNFLSSVHKTIEDYNVTLKHGENPVNIFDALKNQIEPLFDIVKKHSNDPRAGLLLLELQNAKLACNEMKAIRINHRNFLLDNVRKNSKVNNNLKQVTKEMKGLKKRIV